MRITVASNIDINEKDSYLEEGGWEYPLASGQPNQSLLRDADG